jgi:hypothetical protein
LVGHHYWSIPGSAGRIVTDEVIILPLLLELSPTMSQRSTFSTSEPGSPDLISQIELHKNPKGVRILLLTSP